MQTQYHFQHVSDEDKEKIKEYSDKRFEGLEKYLSTFQEDNKLLHIDLEYRDRHKEYELKCNLTLGGKSLHHVEVCHSWMECIDKSEDNLVLQTKKYVDHFRASQKDSTLADELTEEGRDINYDNL